MIRGCEAGLHFSTISNSFIQEETAPSPPPLLFTARSQDYRAAHSGESREHFSCSNAETVAHAVQSANSGREYYVLAPPEFAGLLSLVSCPQRLMRLCAQRLLRFLWSLNPRLLSFLSLLFPAFQILKTVFHLLSHRTLTTEQHHRTCSLTSKFDLKKALTHFSVWPWSN